LRGPFRRQCIERVIGQLHLRPVLHQPIATLSKGFRRRVGLAHALLHDPPVLILDEPTDGLDPNQKHEVRALINQIARAKTIIISTHILEEVAPVCTRAAIIAGGRLLVDETPAALLARSRYRNAVRVSLTGDTADAGRILRDLDGVKVVEAAADGNSWTIFGEDGLDTAERVRACCNQQGWTVLALRAEGGRLDDVFRDLTLSADGEAA
jgi:ABC-2 type transport system ATP-binding protein